MTQTPWDAALIKDELVRKLGLDQGDFAEAMRKAAEIGRAVKEELELELECELNPLKEPPHGTRVPTKPFTSGQNRHVCLNA